MSLLLYSGEMMNGDSYHVELNVRGDGTRLGANIQGYGRLYGNPMALDCKTDDLGDGKE